MAILGIDEVGRGPLAGPLVVGAVILPEEKPEWTNELKDSKKLTGKKRETLNDLILTEAASTGFGWVSPKELDEIGISEALKLATRRAVKAVQKNHVPFSQIVIDGKINFLKGTALEDYVSTVVKADDLVKEVSAASIIAKVTRDQYMVEAGKQYPEYGFEKHVGYGTAKHREAIIQYGICPEHRQSFEPIKSMVGFSRGEIKRKNTTKVGKKGEEVTSNYLTELGHEIVMRNFRTKLCEIDIISIHENKIYFTEVKYRKTNSAGGGLAAINKKKLKQMKFAAECFLNFYSKKCAKLDPLLAVAEVEGEEFIVKDWFLLDD